mgnify:CR=1 FL=1
MDAIISSHSDGTTQLLSIRKSHALPSSCRTSPAPTSGLVHQAHNATQVEVEATLLQHPTLHNLIMAAAIPSEIHAIVQTTVNAMDVETAGFHGHQMIMRNGAHLKPHVDAKIY